MLTRLFPLDSNRILQESKQGVTGALYHQSMLPHALLLIEAAILKLLKMDNRAQLSGWMQVLNSKDKTNETSSYRKQILISAYVMFGAPVVEEIIFRGLLTPGLEAISRAINVDPFYASVGSSILFGAIHPNGQKLATTYIGYELEKMSHINNGSLWGNITRHGANNITCLFPPSLISLIVIYVICKQSIDSIKKLKNTNENLSEHGMSLSFRMLHNALSGAIAGIKVGVIAGLEAVPLGITIPSLDIIASTLCETVRNSVFSVAGGAIVGTILGAAVGAGICFFSNKSSVRGIDAELTQKNDTPKNK